jgi:hypothetical protein
MASRCTSEKSGTAAPDGALHITAIFPSAVETVESVPDFSPGTSGACVRHPITEINILEQHHVLEPVLATNELENGKGDTSTDGASQTASAAAKTHWYDCELESDGEYLDDEEREMHNIEWKNPVSVKPLPGESFQQSLKRTMAEMAASNV